MLDSYTFMSYKTRLQKAFEYYDLHGQMDMPEDWLDYRLFIRDVGERPQGLVLGLINRKEPHSKQNTRWMTVAQNTGKHPYP